MKKTTDIPSRPILCMGPSAFLKRLGIAKRTDLLTFESDSWTPSQWKEAADLLRQGRHLIFFGTAGLSRLEEFWVRSYSLRNIRPHYDAPSHGILKNFGISSRSGDCRCVYLAPSKAYVYHGTDDEPRATLVPWVAARDRFHSILGYPGVMIKHSAGATVSGSFRGGRWHLFAFENPERVMTPPQWRELIDEIVRQCAPGVMISRFYPEYASYRADEEARICCKIINTGPDIACATVRLEAVCEEGGVPLMVEEYRRTLCVGDEDVFMARWRIPELRASATSARRGPIPGSEKRTKGCILLRTAVFHENRFLYGPERDASRQCVDTGECELLVQPPDSWSKGARVFVDGVRLSIAGDRGLHMGTHYYPTPDFYGGMWRDFDVRKAREDFAAMRSCGIRLVRIWGPPHLSEENLRILDVCIQICQENGLVVDLTVFTQWVDELSMDTKDGRVKWNFVTRKDYNVDGVSFHHLDLQRRYVKMLARRYRKVRGLIWNISNECCLNKLDKEQLDPSWLDPAYKKLKPPYDLNHLLKQWLTEMKKAIRSQGCRQPIVTAYCYPAFGGTSSVFSNQEGDVGSYHEYAPPIHSLIHDTTADGKPLILEEFGFSDQFKAPLADDRHGKDGRFRWYDKIVHFALGARLAAACSYEWGVSWLLKDLPPEACYRKYISVMKDLDPRFVMGWFDYANQWPLGSMGICPWAGSLSYGTIFPCVSQPTESIRAMQRLGWIARDLEYCPRNKSVYLLLPMEFDRFRSRVGHRRKFGRILETIQSLWQMHVDFGVVQEHTASRIPSSAKALIVPNQMPLKPELKKAVEKYARQGMEIYLGKDDGWKKSRHLATVPLTGGTQVMMQTRDIQDGAVYVLSHESDPASVGGKASRISQVDRESEACKGIQMETPHRNKVSLEIFSLAMVGEIKKQVMLAESHGLICLNGRRVADSNGKRYILKALDQRSLLATASLLIVPYEPMRLRIYDTRWTRAEVVNPSTEVVEGRLAFDMGRDFIALNVDAECANRAIRLLADVR
ncbi:MAG: hypothetical protein PHV34_18495 [Verrucomicrobiae bacterium]|nr:hypothetical protein [Verrucomicrobiae bacterium]